VVTQVQFLKFSEICYIKGGSVEPCYLIVDSIVDRTLGAKHQIPSQNIHDL
jgi:hypothetical protein